MLSALFAIANPSVCLSLVDQRKMVEVRIVQFSPYSSPIPLFFGGISSIQKFWRVSSERRHQTMVGWGKQAISRFVHQYLENSTRYIQSYH